MEGVYVRFVHPAFYLFLYLTGVHFRGELQHGGDVSQQKISKKSVWTNQNSRNSGVRCTICIKKTRGLNVNILVGAINLYFLGVSYIFEVCTPQGLRYCTGPY